MWNLCLKDLLKLSFHKQIIQNHNPSRVLIPHASTVFRRSINRCKVIHLRLEGDLKRTELLAAGFLWPLLQYLVLETSWTHWMVSSILLRNLWQHVKDLFTSKALTSYQPLTFLCVIDETGTSYPNKIGQTELKSWQNCVANHNVITPKGSQVVNPFHICFLEGQSVQFSLI